MVLSRLGLLAFLPLAACFVVTPHQCRQSSGLEMAAVEGRDEFLKRSFAMICGTAVATMSTPAVAASESTLLSSSPLLLADVVKTLDMSLPSYGEISNYKASVENVKSLSVDPEKEKGLGIAKSRKKVPSASSVLPSMGKSSAEAKKKSSSSMPGYEF